MARALAGATRRLTRTMSLPPLLKALSVFVVDCCTEFIKSDAGCGHRMLCVRVRRFRGRCVSMLRIAPSDLSSS